jgi:hypothetical protein
MQMPKRRRSGAHSQKQSDAALMRREDEDVFSEERRLEKGTVMVYLLRIVFH